MHSEIGSVREIFDDYNDVLYGKCRCSLTTLNVLIFLVQFAQSLI